MKVAICDDEQASLDAIVQYFKMRDDLSIEYILFKNGEDLLLNYQVGEYDVLFIDIEMPRLSGTETAIAVRSMDSQVVIVFVTSYSQYMKESFRCSPTGFVEKAHLWEDLNLVMLDVVARLNQKRHHFCFNDHKKTVRLYCDEIIYCEKKAHYVEIYTKKELYRTRMTLKNMELALEAGRFFRISRGFLVNLSYVKAIKGNYVVLRECAVELVIGRGNKEAFHRALYSFKAKEVRL